MKLRTAFVSFSLAAILSTALSADEKPAAPLYKEHQDLSYYLDEAGTKHPVKSPKDWEIRRGHLLAHMQTVMGPLPKPEQPVPLDMKVLEEKPIENFVRKKISYHTDSKDRRVNAYLFLPKETTKKVAAVLCLHQTITIGKEEPAGLGRNANLQYALHLAQRGYVTLAPDYPSFGEYEYDFAPKHGYISGSMKAVYDNIRAIDLLQSLPEVDGERIGCVGHSLGGHNTMFTAIFEPRIKAMVSSCGFTRFHKYYGGRLKGWTSTRYMPLIDKRYHNSPNEVPFDFTEIVAAFAPRPFFTNSPLHDDNFEVSGVRDVIDVATPIYELYGKVENLQAIYPDAAHSFPPDARDLAYDFFDKHLGHTPPTK